MKADNIKNIISDIDHLPYRAILFDGTWGIGKSYAVNEALEANPNVCKISMFGLKDTRQIYLSSYAAPSIFLFLPSVHSLPGMGAPDPQRYGTDPQGH